MNPESTPAYRYVISGLLVESDVDLTSAIPHAFEGLPDVAIREGVLPPGETPLPGDGTDTVFRFRVPEIGRFLMRNGQELLYEVAPGCDSGLLALHLVGICFATLLQQRGSIVLHASAISVGGKAMLFCGESGAGKSTLAAMLSDLGYPLLNDDVCSLHREADGTFSVSPDGRMLKLWATSLEQLNHAERGAEVIGRTNKFYALPSHSDANAHPVGAVYFLQQQEDGQPTLTPLGPARAMASLQSNAYRPELVSAMGQQDSYFKAAAILCRTVPMLQLNRQKDFLQAGKVMNLLETSWKADSVLPVTAR